MESLLESRQEDAVAVLLSLGFGAQRKDQDPVARIPARFLVQPSQVCRIQRQSQEDADRI